jgi:hypothetical protein
VDPETRVLKNDLPAVLLANSAEFDHRPAKVAAEPPENQALSLGGCMTDFRQKRTKVLCFAQVPAKRWNITVSSNPLTNIFS